MHKHNGASQNILGIGPSKPSSGPGHDLTKPVICTLNCC